MPPRDTAPPTTGTARIRGVVSAADTGTPLRRAIVRLGAREMGPQGRTTMTDAEGRYDFRDLPAGRYTLSAMKGGFVALQYGQRRPFEAGRPLEVANGQQLSGVDLALPRGSVITGRVVDEFGEPVADAMVSAMRYQYMRGRRRLFPAGRTSQTNDLGQYRIFGLSPAEYYVSASVRDMSFGGEMTGEVSGFAPTYFPGTANLGEAQRVAAPLGQEIVADITLVPAHLVNVSGTIVDSTGKPVTNGMIRLSQPGELPVFGMSMGRIRENGAFTINGVAPGSYNLNVTARPGPDQRSDAPDEQPREMEAATVPVTVGSDNVEGLVVTTSKGATMTGQIVIESGISNVSASNIRVSAFPVDPDQMMGGFGSGSGRVNDDWTFELRNLFGRVAVSAGAGGPGGGGAMGALGSLQLKAVNVAGRDVTDSGVELKPQQLVRNVQIVLTDKRTELSGTVTDAHGQPSRDYVVVAFPEDEDKWNVVTNRYTRTSRPDQNGRYTITGLPPGDYLAIALDYLDQESGGPGNPEVLARLRDLATRVQLGENEKKTLDLKLVIEQ